MPKVSIIIPVYNVEKYIKECLDSILVQEYKDYEIILIDDGSTDGSGDICDGYSKGYEFVRTHHQGNQGLSNARNQGVGLAKGEYILFVDADDCINKGSLSKIIETLSETPELDFMFLNGAKLFSDNKKVPFNMGYIKSEILNKDIEKVYDHLSKLDKYPGSAWAKLIRRSLIIDNNVYFLEDIAIEDIEWVLRLFSVAKTFNYCDYEYYYYRQGVEGSITNKGGRARIDDLISIIKNWAEISLGISGSFSKLIDFTVAYEYVIAMANLWSLEKEARKEVLKNLKGVKWVIKKSDNKKVRITRVAIKVFGIYGTSWILRKYLKIAY